jgi:hypothetical protein
MSSPTIHVKPRDGRWVVQPEGVERPVSEHGDATAAAAAAAAHAEAAGGGDVLVHDRYHHVHLTRRDRRPSGAARRRSP